MTVMRKSYNTTLRADLMKQVRILAVTLERRQNDLLEEAVEDIIAKYAPSESHDQAPRIAQSAVQEKRTSYNTPMNTELMKRFRILAIQLDRRQNDLFEEAIVELFNKYGHRTESIT